jgi:hypothetical protein
MAAKRILSRSDCRPIKERITQVEAKIANVENDLGDPDLSRAIKKQLKIDLKKLKLLHAQLARALETCEAIVASPSR